MTYTHDLPHEPQFPKSPESPAHFDTLARLLSVDPELVPAALANLIASEREAARSEALGEAADRLNVEAVGFQAGWGSNPIDQAKLWAIGECLTWLRDLANTT